VICYYPWDLDRTVETKKGRSSPEEGRRRGAGGSRDHGEGVPAGFDGDEVLDDVQESTARSKTWSSTSEASCKLAEEWLEIRPRQSRAEHGGVRRVGADLGSVTHTGDSDGQGGADGEIFGVRVLWSSGDWSPEFRLAAARFDRGSFRHSEEKKEMQTCQGVVRARGEQGGAEERGRGLL
jgi:hypothetical protein